MARLTQQQLETHLWGSAGILRGRTAGQDYKTYILSLLFFKRLSDQFDCEADEKIEQLEKERGSAFTEAQRARLRTQPDIHRFKIPVGCHWDDVRQESTDTGRKLKEAMDAIAAVNGDDLIGVFTVDWNQPSPDGKGGKLIATSVVNALIEHFTALPNGQAFNLSNRNVSPDILGRAYEYLIKMFADDAGAKAGEFFTPSEVVDILIRILEPRAGDTVYDPTCGSGGMLVHSADFLQEHGHDKSQIRYYGQEMNWQTYAIARINTILHGLEADIKGGKSTITDPQFTTASGISQFSLVIANFPFSDEFWWLPSEQHSEEQAKKAKKDFAKNGYIDKHNRFTFGKPPAGTGDWAFIQHIIASTTADGRAGVVCPQGVLFRGQPEIEEETGEFDADGIPKIRRRKADDEYLIRKGLLDARLIEAVIALPLNIFYGAGVPACLLILNKNRPQARRDKVLLVYAARHYRELSAMNQLRPQDVMRILVHFHAYGDAKAAKKLVDHHTDRLKKQIDADEKEQIARLFTEYQPHAEKLAAFEKEVADLGAKLAAAAKKTEQAKIEKSIARVQAAAEKVNAQLAKRDEAVAEVKKRAAEDCQAVDTTGAALIAMYADPAELAKHARVVEMAEIEENESNLNIPRYVDTFEPEKPVDIKATLAELDATETERKAAEKVLRKLLEGVASC